MQLTTRSPSWRVSSFLGSPSPNLLCLVQYICYLSLDVHPKTVTAIYPHYASYHVVWSSGSNDPNWLSSHHIQLVLSSFIPYSSLLCPIVPFSVKVSIFSWLKIICLSYRLCHVLFLVLFHSYLIFCIITLERTVPSINLDCKLITNEYYSLQMNINIYQYK